MGDLKDTENTESDTVAVMHKFEIVQYVAEQWYVLWYTKVKDISHLYVYRCIYKLTFQNIRIKCVFLNGNFFNLDPYFCV